MADQSSYMENDAAPVTTNGDSVMSQIQSQTAAAKSQPATTTTTSTSPSSQQDTSSVAQEEAPIQNQPEGGTMPQQKTTSDVKFGANAAAQQNLDPTYLDTRDNTISSAFVDNLNNAYRSGQTLSDAMRDQILAQTVKQYGGQVDWGSSDWKATIDRIYGKALSSNSTGDWNSLYTKIGSRNAYLTKYTSGKDLLNAVNNGDVTSNQLADIQKNKPAIYAEYTAEKQKQASNLSINGEDVNDPAAAINSVNDYMKGLGIDLTNSASIDLYSKRQELLNSPEIQSSRDQLSSTKSDYLATKDSYDNILKEVRSEYKNSGATESRIRAIASKRQEDMQEDLENKQRAYMLAQDDYNMKIADAKDNYEALKDQATFQMQQESQFLQKFQMVYSVYQDQRDRADKFTLLDIQYQQDIQKMKMQADLQFDNYKKQTTWTEGDINSQDPEIVQRGIKSQVDQIMATYDGLLISSRQQLIDRINNGMNQGKSAGDVVAEIMKDVTQKPEYSAWKAAKLGIDNKPIALGGDMVAMPDGKGGYVVGKSTDFAKTVTPDIKKSIQEAIQQQRAINGTSEYDNATAAQVALSLVGQDGGPCGSFINKVNSSITAQYGGTAPWWTNTLQEKINTANSPQYYSPIPVVGGDIVLDMGIVWDWDKNGKPYNAGHVVKVSSVDANGTIHYVDSNGDLKNPWKVGTGTININDSRIKGMTVAPGRSSASNIANGDSSTKSWYNPSMEPLYIKYWSNGGNLSQTELEAYGYGKGSGQKFTQEAAAFKMENGNKQFLNDAALINKVQSFSKQFEQNTKTDMEADKMANLAKNSYSAAIAGAKDGKISAKNTTTQTMINAFNKLLDPNSVVREGEYARSAEGQSLLSRMDGIMQSIKDGGNNISVDTLNELNTAITQFSNNNRNSIYQKSVKIKNQMDNIYGTDINDVFGGYDWLIQRFNQDSQKSTVYNNITSPLGQIFGTNPTTSAIAGAGSIKLDFSTFPKQ